jgi:hypothetical protein
VKQISINPDQLTVDQVWEYYQNIRDILDQMYEQAKDFGRHNPSAPFPQFFGMNIQEIDEFFQKNLEEADRQACLFLIAAAEAALRVDFLQRVYKKKTDDVSRLFRDIYKGKPDDKKKNIGLEADILNIWSEKVPHSKSHISDFRGALNYRHWLAHGRYWVPKLGRKYDPVGILNVIDSIFNDIGLVED